MEADSQTYIFEHRDIDKYQESDTTSNVHRQDEIKIRDSGVSLEQEYYDYETLLYDYLKSYSLSQEDLIKLRKRKHYEALIRVYKADEITVSPITRNESFNSFVRYNNQERVEHVNYQENVLQIQPQRNSWKVFAKSMLLSLAPAECRN